MEAHTYNVDVKWVADRIGEIKSEAACLISNSIKSKVTLVPEIR
jgi:hypothetical protein